MKYSVRFNGVELGKYIDVLHGFTPYTGATWMPELKSISKSDGLYFDRTRNESKTIVMPFTMDGLIGEKYDNLQLALNVREPKELIFEGMPDRVFYAIPDGDLEYEDEGCIGSGVITWIVPDGIAHGIEEKVYRPNADDGTTFVIKTEGNYRAYPVIEAYINSDCGFIGFVNESESVIQIGNPDELDIGRVDLSERLIHEDLTTSSLNGGWVANAATLVTNGSGAEHKQTNYFEIDANNQTMQAAGWGTGTGWHGPSVTKAIPADSKGHVGAKNCTYSFRTRFCSLTNNDLDLGIQEFLMTDKNDKNIAAIVFYKHWHNSRQGVCSMHILGDNVVATKRVPLSTGNDITGNDHGRCSIRKFGGDITFDISGDIYSFHEPRLEEVEVAKISLWTGNFGTYNTMYRNQIRSIEFVSHSVENWQDIPNKFAAGDVVKVDCGSGKIYLNDVHQPGLGALGNNWESFYLSSGQNQIHCTQSEWATQPTFVLKYREAYL